ncbi:MAG: hypothetical protein HY075_08605 [Deltaproteobacteria bacterium]|nr:hypothetical protein [Deltaproteobacteria bacterium]
MKPEFPVDVGTQDFVAVDCANHEDAGVDLTFQLGYETLDARQRAFLADARKYVGIAVRTSYDEVNLRGKGFIYISSDRGPNRFDADTIGSGSPFVAAPWAFNGLLYRVLAHELGHVFGIPHLGGSVRNFSSTHNDPHDLQKTFALMSEQYPEEIVQRENYAAFIGDDAIDPFFMPRTEFHECALSSSAVRFFGLSTDQACVHVGFQLRENAVDVDLYASATERGPRLRFGHASWTDWDKESSKLNMQMVVLVRITPRQRVFKFEGDKNPPFLVAAMIFGLDFPITYLGPDGGKRSLYFRLAPQAYEAIGELDGRVVLLLNGK